MVQLAYYQHKLKQGYDAKVRLRPLAPEDLVFKKSAGHCKESHVGKARTKLGRTVSYHLGGEHRSLLFRRFR